MELKKYDLLRSRKFWAAVVGIVYSMIYMWWPDFPIPEESVVGLVGTVVSYILGVALEDGLAKKNGMDLRGSGKEKNDDRNDQKNGA